MKRDSLDTHDVLPEDMISYLANYGRHFNKKLCEFAISNMFTTEKDNDKKVKLKKISKEEIDNLLRSYNVRLENNQLYDYIYVAHMCKADFLYKSVPDEHHMALYIKDVIDDVDGYDGLVFNRWYADTRRKGIAIDWEEML